MRNSTDLRVTTQRRWKEKLPRAGVKLSIRRKLKSQNIFYSTSLSRNPTMTGDKVFLLMAVLLATGHAAPSWAQDVPIDTGWHAYDGAPGGTRYRALDPITAANVDSLQRAWTYRTGKHAEGSPVAGTLIFEATPIFFDEPRYLSTAFGEVIAPDAANGTERWRFDPQVGRSRNYSELPSRGVSLWIDTAAASDTACAARVFIGTIDAQLLSLDAATGEPCRDFDVRTGETKWSWDPLLGNDRHVGAANAWSVISADPERDLVFVPTGSPSPDFYGGLRPGDNRHANSVVALRASTGDVVWPFQTAHHGLWDYDLAVQPNGGGPMVTAGGLVFLLPTGDARWRLPCREGSLDPPGAI
jgi:quinoprotein glucose dehydrogenase